jgi:hypothetical protein
MTLDPCCLTCGYSSMRDASNPKRDESLKAMARQGFICCEQSPLRAEFRGFEDRCEDYTDAAREVMEARIEWVKKQRGSV